VKDLSHLDAEGRARMVDVGAKSETARTARAEGSIRMSAQALAAVESNAVAKGDVIAVARIAGIMAAKKTAELIPLTAWASTHGKTGVEMEALTAASVALLTIYDMAKAIDRAMEISGVRLTEKRGGKSGWTRE